MPILPSDIKLLESERMRDTSDGGGRMTGRVIPSGEAGNIFPKVSRIDAVNGRVNLRKVYLAVRTATLDMYAGAHIILTEPPENDRISVCLFSTRSAFDQRSAARDRIESYVVAGPLSRMRLYGDQLIGQKAITIYQMESEPLPEVGQVFVLSVETAGVATAQQYVRVTDVDHELRTFTDDRGEFRRRVVTLTIGSKLAQTYRSNDITRYSTTVDATRVRLTQVADASEYFGIQPLAQAGEIGAKVLQLASVYAPLVPSTQRETAVSLAEPGGARLLLPGPFESAQTYVLALGDASPSFTFGAPIAPGSLRVTAQSSGNLVVTDDGKGRLVRMSDGVVHSIISGSIDYEAGTVSMAMWFTGEILVAVQHAISIVGAAHARSIPVTLETRGSIVVQTLAPLPAPGSVWLEYRALGRWYTLRDTGAGVLEANDPNEGTAQIDYTTGALVATLGALPDVGSDVIIRWGSPAHYTVRAGATADAGTTLRLRYTLQHAPVVPGSWSAQFAVGAGTVTATDAAANGNITGSGVTGTIDYATGDVTLDFSTPPNRDALITNAYTWRDGDILSGTTATVSGGQFTVPGTAPFRNGGRMTFAMASGASAAGYITAGGQVRVRGGSHTPAGSVIRYSWSDQQVGTFNAATGVVTLTSAVQASAQKYEPGIVLAAGGGSGGSPGWSSHSASYAITGVSDIAVERDSEAYDPQAVTDEQINPSALGLTLDLTATTGDAIVPGSVWLRLCGRDYIERDGTLYISQNAAGGYVFDAAEVGLQAGSLDYTTGIAAFTYWADGAAVSRTVKACLTTYGTWTAVDAAFRTAGSPVRAGSLYVQVTAADGELLTATANTSGVIAGTDIAGEIQQDMGVVRLQFGHDDGGTWVPREVIPGTLRYNTVVLTNLPLDPGLLGLDPVRLPADGRVPIFRPGNTIVLHNTQRTALTNPVAAGQTYSVGRSACEVITVEDANGAELPADRYVADLAAGTVTMAADWDGTGIAQPLVAVHRIEHMTALTDVQINGSVEMADALTREFPVEGTYCSSALLCGDMQAIVTNVFDQQTWTQVWSDTLIGTQANAQYDDINYPIEVLNESAVTERWRVSFTGTGTFQVYGENLGLIATGSTSADCAPLSPVTGEPYFVIRAGGWGGGWASGNQLRFNTVGGNAPAWIARTVLSGATREGDRFHLEGRGDTDAI